MTFNGLRRLRLQVMISPALENDLSLATDVAGTAKYTLASLPIYGKRTALSFHHVNTFCFASSSVHSMGDSETDTDSSFSMNWLMLSAGVTLVLCAFVLQFHAAVHLQK